MQKREDQGNMKNKKDKMFGYFDCKGNEANRNEMIFLF